MKNGKLDISHLIVSVIIGYIFAFILVNMIPTNYLYIYEHKKLFLIIASFLFFIVVIDNIIRKLKVINNSENTIDIHMAKLAIITIVKGVFIFILAISAIYIL